MADRDVSVDFNVNGSAYASSLQQMIAATQQYNTVADTMIGKVAKFSGAITTTMINKTAGLTAANKLATAQAAAYQQKMSSLQATATIVGEKTFPKLEKATLKMAREFPIGIGQAVDQMESLQKSGVTTVDTMSKLAVTYTKLGAATGTYAPVIGQAMTEFTRGMGNNLDMAQGFGDSLVSLTKKYGGSAEGVLAFSKSIAPIASTIGLGQAQVMGLSTAFARTGEDGFAAANAINKVMIDLNKSARDGGPELRMYANAMNKSVDELRTQLNTDPASVIVDFTQAIQKEGPNAIRVLESLGIEGVRTVKAFTTLSREGNLGQIINEASASYGSGTTQKAAESALSGVNDQMATLQESTSQMIAAAGKPFLSWLEMVLKASNAVAGAFTSIAQSGFMQNLAKVGAVVSTAGGVAGSAISAAGTYALLSRGVRGAGRARERFATGVAEGRSGAAFADGPRGPLLTRLGQGYGAYGPNVGAERAARAAAREAAGVGVPGRTAAGLARQAVGGGLRGLWTAGIVGTNLVANDIRTGIGREAVTTRGGEAFRAGLAGAGAQFKAGDATAGMAKLNSTISTAAKEATNGSKAFGTMGRALVNLTGATARAGVSVGGMAGRGAMSFLGGLGIGPQMLAVAGVGAAAWGASKVRANQRSDEEAMQATTTDPYRAFNDFATKAGYATEQVTLLGQAAGAAARAIADQNATSDETYTLSAQERETATATGYQAAWTTSTGNSVDDAIRAYMENPNQTSSEIARRGMDVTAAHGEEKGQAFLNEYEALKAQEAAGTLTPTTVAAKGIAAQEAAQGSFGWENDTSRAQAAATAGYFTQRWSEQGETQGAASANRTKEADLESLYATAAKGNKEQQEEYSALISTLSGVDKETIQRGMLGVTDANGNTTQMNWGDVLNTEISRGDEGGQAAALRREADARANNVPLPPEVNAARNNAASQDKVFYQVTGAMVDLTDSIWAGNDLAKEQNKTVKELTEQDMKSLSFNEKQIVLGQQSPNDQQALSAGARSLVDEAMKKSGGDIGAARGSLKGQLAVANSPEMQAMLGQALGKFGQNAAVMTQTTGMSTMGRIGQTIDIGRTAATMPLPPGATPEAIAANEADIAAGADALSQAQDMQRQYVAQVRQTMISLQRSQEDTNKSIARAQEDFARQQLYAAQDYHHQVAISRKQFHISMVRAEEDYHKAIRRTTRDFNISMARSEQSFQRQRMRTTADYNRQLERQAEDNAKAMYDPYQRVAYKRVWDAKQMVSNLKEQNEVLARQMSAVDQMKGLGLSQAAVDTLDLANPENAQQALKMLADMMSDPSLIGQMNAQIAGRVDLSQMFTTDVDNVGYRRAQEDFKTSMDRMTEDYKTQVKQAKEDFKKGLNDMQKDYAESKSRAREDFNLQMKEMARAHRVANTRAAEAQATAMARLRTDAATARRRVIEDLTAAGETMFEDFNTLNEDTAKYLAGLPERQRTKVEKAMKTLSDFITNHQWPTPEMTVRVNYVTGKVEAPKFPLPVDPQRGREGADRGGGGAGDIEPGLGPTGEERSKTQERWQYYSDGRTFHGGADIGHRGGGAYSVITGKVKNVVTLATTQNQRGSFGRYVVISDGKHDFYYAHLAKQEVTTGQNVRPGTRVGTIGNTGHTLPIGSGYHLHFEARPAGAGHKSAINPNPWLAMGGIATRQMNATIGEAGYPEAVIPLNDRGARLLSDVLLRYASANEAKTSRVAPHSTTVVNNSTIRQDYSTNFTGPVSVEANDPAEFARALRQQTRSKRLLQPTAGA